MRVLAQVKMSKRVKPKLRQENYLEYYRADTCR